MGAKFKARGLTTETFDLRPQICSQEAGSQALQASWKPTRWVKVNLLAQQNMSGQQARLFVAHRQCDQDASQANFAHHAPTPVRARTLSLIILATDRGRCIWQRCNNPVNVAADEVDTAMGDGDRKQLMANGNTRAVFRCRSVVLQFSKAGSVKPANSVVDERDAEDAL